MYKAVLTLLLGLMLLASGSAHALILNCERTTERHDAFSTQRAFESWFPKNIRPTKADQIPTNKDTQIRFQINGAIYDLTPSKWMAAKLPEKGGYKSVTGVRYKCNASPARVKSAFRNNKESSGGSTQSATAGNVNKYPHLSDSGLCNFATRQGRWEKQSNYLPYVKEAKRRGLTCGVGESGSIQTTAAKPYKKPWFNEKFKGVNDANLCANRWSGYWTEALLRGLTCGVDEKGSAQTAAAPKPSVSSAELTAAQKEAQMLREELAALKAEKEQQQTTIEADNQVPLIDILSVETTGKQGLIKGYVADNTGIAEVTVDGNAVPVTSSGSFEYRTFVPPNGIDVQIQATDIAGLTSVMSVSLERSASTATASITFDRLNPLGKRVKANRDALALIVGVADYENTPAKAIFADSDALMFRDYASEKLGIPENRIKTLVDDGADIREVLLGVKRWLARAVKQEQSDVYVFFAGHGLASDDGEKMYLLPYDGAPELLDDTAIARERLFSDIANANPRSVTVFLDTCYSGTTRGPEMLIASRPISIRAKESSIPEGFTVMTAAAGNQTAKPLEEAKHGMFSYFLMKGMEGEADTNQDNEITAGELHAYVQQNVIQQSSGSQTPEIQGDADRVLVRFQ